MEKFWKWMNIDWEKIKMESPGSFFLFCTKYGNGIESTKNGEKGISFDLSGIRFCDCEKFFSGYNIQLYNIVDNINNQKRNKENYLNAGIKAIYKAFKLLEEKRKKYIL